MVDRRKVCLVFLLISFFRAITMRNKLKILTVARRRRGQVLLVLTLVTSEVHFAADVRTRRAWSLSRPQGRFSLMLSKRAHLQLLPCSL